MSDDRPPEPAPNPNRARDHLANERTYLAWMRTALAMMAFGVVIVRMGSLAPNSARLGWDIGLVFAVLGLLTVGLATWHYFRMQRLIERDAFEPSGAWMAAYSAVVLLVGGGVVAWLLLGPLGPAFGGP